MGQTMSKFRGFKPEPKKLPDRKLASAVAAYDSVLAESTKIRAAKGLDPVPDGPSITAFRNRLAALEAKPSRKAAAKPKPSRSVITHGAEGYAINGEPVKVPTIAFTDAMAFRMSGRELKALAESPDCGEVARREIDRRKAKRAQKVKVAA